LARAISFSETKFFAKIISSIGRPLLICSSLTFWYCSWFKALFFKRISAIVFSSLAVLVVVGEGWADRIQLQITNDKFQILNFELQFGIFHFKF